MLIEVLSIDIDDVEKNFYLVTARELVDKEGVNSLSPNDNYWFKLKIEQGEIHYIMSVLGRTDLKEMRGINLFFEPGIGLGISISIDGFFQERTSVFEKNPLQLKMIIPKPDCVDLHLFDCNDKHHKFICNKSIISSLQKKMNMIDCFFTISPKKDAICTTININYVQIALAEPKLN